MTATQNDYGNKGIILFDGVCNYCNAMVNFALKRDHKDHLRFAPLQSETGMALRAEYGVSPDIDSFIYIENGKAHLYSTGALKVCKHLGAGWPLMAGFFIIPAFIRDLFYKWIARNRYRFFGKKEACMVPTPAMRGKFLA
jgi:predicted DCC family thiol-disulfide oxidoreductase YuxK